MVDIRKIEDMVEATNNVAPIQNKTAFWLRHRVKDSDDLCECSNCGALVKSKRDVCPGCFSNMTEEE